MAAIALTLLACGGGKRPVPVTVLGPPTDSVVTEFGEVSRAAWLGAERWALLAPGDEAVAIADFSTHKVHKLGGRGAEEIRNPSTLFRAGDTLFVGDWSLRRTTLWTLQGKAAGSIPASNVVRGILHSRAMLRGDSTTRWRPGPAPMAPGIGTPGPSCVRA